MAAEKHSFHIRLFKVRGVAIPTREATSIVPCPLNKEKEQHQCLSEILVAFLCRCDRSREGDLEPNMSFQNGITQFAGDESWQRDCTFAILGIGFLAGINQCVSLKSIELCQFITAEELAIRMSLDLHSEAPEPFCYLKTFPCCLYT